MRLEHLAYFVEIARCMSINKAAKNLFITQPALTVALNALEEELGFKLLNRSYQGVTLTLDGEQVLADAQSILGIANRWKLLSKAAIEISGDVHIVANPAPYSFIMNKVVFELAQTYPKLNIFPYEVKMQALLSYLKKKIARIGIGAFLELKEIFSLIEEKDWKIDSIFEDVFAVFISTKNTLAQKDILTIADLKNLTLSMYPDKDDIIVPFIKKYFNNERYLRFSKQDFIMQKVVENKAIAVFPKLMMQHTHYIQNKLVRAMANEAFNMPITYCIIYPSKPSVAERRVMEVIKTHLFDHITEFNEMND